jgi:putative protease
VTTDFLVQQGAARITLSPELTLEQMADVAGHTEAPLEALVHGRLTLMTSEYCSIGHATACQMPGGSWAPCHGTQYALEDRTGARFPLATDGACRMYILNAVELAMLNRLPDLAAAGLDVVRIESIGTAPEALREQVRLYLAALARPGLVATRAEWKALEATCGDGFTTGHFYRGPA